MDNYYKRVLETLKEITQVIREKQKTKSQDQDHTYVFELIFNNVL